jgi:acyl-CoA reductase-like NAD-dependent aldehyde dehydrogenase
MTSDAKLPPPDSYTSWLDYAVQTMETRDLFLTYCDGSMEAWNGLDDVHRSDMRQAAADELATLRERCETLETTEHGEIVNLREQLAEALAALRDIAKCALEGRWNPSQQ